MEASVANILSPGDKAIAIRGGKFGERFGELCDAYGIDFIPIDVEWGEAVDPSRVKTVLRRKTKEAKGSAGPEGKVLRFSGWTLDMDGQFVKSENDEIVSLTAYEFQVLAALAQNSGRVLGREQILDLVAARNWDPYDRSIDVLIGKIRRKLKDDPRKPTIIKTVRNAGYLFMAKTE